MEELNVYKRNVELLANTKSNKKVLNGGLPYAAILFGVLFKHCKEIARIYCTGLKPDLVCLEPFWCEFCNYLNDENKKLYVLVDSLDWINNKPMQYIKKIKGVPITVKENKKVLKHKNNKRLKKRSISKTITVKKPTDRIIVKQIHPDHIKEIEMIYGEATHFSIFDNEKFRYEYDSENYKAFGSFNQPETSQKLIELFDRIFNDPKSKIII